MVYVGLFAATCVWVRNYFRPYLSISACAIEVQHSNENSTTILARQGLTSEIEGDPYFFPFVYDPIQYTFVNLCHNVALKGNLQQL